MGKVFKKGVIIVFLVIYTLVLSLNAYSAVLINEIMYNPSTAQGDDSDLEWIELFNDGTQTINLENFTINGNNFDDMNITAGGFVIVARELIDGADSDLNSFEAYYGNNDSIWNSTDASYTAVDGNFVLENTAPADIINLLNGTYTQLVNYTPFLSLANGNGKTLIFYKGNFTESAFVNGTPGSSNDQFAPDFNKWVNPSNNNTFISGLFNITVNITDVTNVSSALVNFNNTNFSMTKQNDLWSFLWNTSLNIQKAYNLTVFFNDSYGKSSSDTLFDILVNNSPRIGSFSPSGLTQTLVENSTLNFNVNASDPDDVLLNYSWFIDNILNSTSPNNFSYKPGFSDNGTHTINATVKDSANQVSIKWAITVTNFNRAPTLDSISNKLFSKNINSSFNITASDPDGDSLTFSHNHSSIAISKINNSMATVSWKPTNLDLGNNIINFSVSDSTLIDSEIAIIIVNFSTNTAPNITTSAKTTAIVNEQYRYDVDATDLDNDTLRFSISTNASGMSIDSSTGVISFNPTSTGLFSVNVSVSDLTEITNQSFSLSAVYGTRLKISDVDVKVDGKKSSNIANTTKIGKEAEPSSEVEFKVKVKNDFTKSEDIKIEDIEVKVTIEEIDEDEDLEEESKEFDLSPEDDKTVTLKFNLPLNVDDGTFDVLIEADGSDENGNEQGQYFRIELEVEKEKHDLRFLSFELTPTMINCNRIANIDYKIINVGLEDEENVILELKNDDLGLLLNEKNIAIDSGTEDNTFSNSIKLKVGDEIQNGIYPIAANVYTEDNKLRDTKTKEIRVEDCIKTKEETIPLELQQFGQSKGIESKKEQIQTPAIEISFKEAEQNLRLIVLSTFVFTTFFVFTAIVLYARL